MLAEHGGEPGRSAFAERAVRAHFVVVTPPRSDRGLGMLQ